MNFHFPILTKRVWPVFAERPKIGSRREAMIAIVIARAMLEKFGGDSLDETRRAYAAYQDTIGPRGQSG